MAGLATVEAATSLYVLRGSWQGSPASNPVCCDENGANSKCQVAKDTATTVGSEPVTVLNARMT